MPSYKNPGVIEFEEKIVASDGSGAYIEFPYDVQEMFGVKGRVPIKAKFDGIDYRGSLCKMGSPAHILIVIKDIREQIGKSVGDSVRVELALDEDERTIELPEDVRRLIDANAAARQTWNSLAFSHQREYSLWLESAKRSETREKRVGEMVQKLAAGEKLR